MPRRDRPDAPRGRRGKPAARPAPDEAARPRSGRPRPHGGGDEAEAASAPRIIGGRLRGRRLAFQPDPRTRPMKDRVRETLFDLLGTSVVGSVAIDCFAGSGALGFEAVSRGAARAILAERHFPTAERLRRSALDLGVADRVEVRAGDVLVWVRQPPPLPAEAPWTVFISPPWEMFRSRADDLIALIALLQENAPPGSCLAVEADTAFPSASLPQPAGEGRWTTRTLAPAVLHLWRDRG